MLINCKADAHQLDFFGGITQAIYLGWANNEITFPASIKPKIPGM